MSIQFKADSSGIRRRYFKTGLRVEMSFFLRMEAAIEDRFPVSDHAKLGWAGCAGDQVERHSDC